MTIFETRYKAKKAKKEKNDLGLEYKVLKYKEGYIVACGL